MAFVDSQHLFSTLDFFTLDSRHFYSRLSTFTLDSRLLLSTLDNYSRLSTFTLDSRPSTFRYTRSSVVTSKACFSVTMVIPVDHI